MSDIYRIGVHLAMSSNAAAVLAGLSKNFLHLHGSVEQLEKRMHGLSRTTVAVGGALLAIGGIAILGAFKKVTDHAKELTKELTLLKNMGLSQGIINGMQAAARAGTVSVAGSTEAQNLKFQREAYSVFGAQNATTIMPYLSKFAQLSGDVNGGDYKKGEDDVLKLIRSGDLMGKFINEKNGLADPEKVKGFMDLVGKMVTAGGGMFDASTMLALAQQGGPALSNMSDDGLMSMFMAAQDMGGFRAGTAASSLKQQFTGGTMTKAVAQEAHDLGLIGKFTMAGQKVVLGKDQTKFQSLLNTDMLGAGKELEKILSDKGYKTKNDQINELYKVLSRQTSQRLIADIIRNLTNKTAERGRVEGVQTLDDQLKNFNQQDIGTNEHNLQSAWENLMQAIAGPSSKVYIEILQSLTSGINRFTEVVRKADPKTIENMAYAVTILGAAFIGAGAAALIAALGPAGWLILGIGLLAATFVAFKKPLDEAIAKWDTIAANIKTSLIGVIEMIGSEIKSWPSRLADTIMGFGRSIIDMFKGALSALNPFTRTAYTGGGAGGGGGGFIQANYTGSYDGPGGVKSDGGSMYDAIMRSEIPNSKHPYSETLGYGAYGKPGDLTKMSLNEVYAASEAIRHNPRNRTNAGPMGAFQILGSTMKAAAKALGYDLNKTKFDEYHQQAMASWIAKTQGLGAWEGLKVHPHEMARARAAGVPRPVQKPTVIHTHVHVDGKVMAKVVTRHQTEMAYLPNAIGTHDSFGSYFPPGGTQVPS